MHVLEVGANRFNTGYTLTTQARNARNASLAAYNSTMLNMFVGVLWSGGLFTWIKNLSWWTNCKLGDFVHDSSAQYSSMLLAVMSVEKFFALYFPLKAKSYCTVRTAKWVTRTLALVIAGLNVPIIIWFKYGKYGCAVTKHLYYIMTIHPLLYSTVPLVLMLLANIAIIAKLMNIKYKGISHTNQSVSKSSTRGSVMVVTVSLAFIILTTPRAVDSAMGNKILAHPLGYAIVFVMQYLNHSINGILYCIFGQKFRKELSNVISRCRKKTMQNSSTRMNVVTTNTPANTMTVNPLQHTETFIMFKG